MDLDILETTQLAPNNQLQMLYKLWKHVVGKIIPATLCQWKKRTSDIWLVIVENNGLNETLLQTRRKTNAIHFHQIECELCVWRPSCGTVVTQALKIFKMWFVSVWKSLLARPIIKIYCDGYDIVNKTSIRLL